MCMTTSGIRLPVWCVTTSEATMKLERVHRQMLLRASNTATSTPTQALEVLCQVPPL